MSASLEPPVFQATNGLARKGAPTTLLRPLEHPGFQTTAEGPDLGPASPLLRPLERGLFQIAWNVGGQ